MEGGELVYRGRSPHAASSIHQKEGRHLWPGVLIPGYCLLFGHRGTGKNNTSFYYFGRGNPVILVPWYLMNIRDIGFGGTGIPGCFARYLPMVISLFSEDCFLLWSEKNGRGSVGNKHHIAGLEF